MRLVKTAKIKVTCKCCQSVLEIDLNDLQTSSNSKEDCRLNGYVFPQPVVICSECKSEVEVSPHAMPPHWIGMLGCEI